MEIIRAVRRRAVTYRASTIGGSIKLWDLPDRVPIGVAAGGERRQRLAAGRPPHRHRTQPAYIDGWNARGPAADRGRRPGDRQIPISWDPSRSTPPWNVRTTSSGGSPADGPPTPTFPDRRVRRGDEFLRPGTWPSWLRPDLDAIVEKVRLYWEALPDIALIQIGDSTLDRFPADAAEPLLERLREAAGRSADRRCDGRPERIRTPDQPGRNRMLYPLSYGGRRRTLEAAPGEW